MKVLHISASDRGGAGIAAVRLHEALLGAGVESKLLTLAKHDRWISEHVVYSATDVARFPPLCRLKLLINRVLRRLGIKDDFYRTFRNRQLAGRPAGYEAFSFNISEHNLERHPLIAEADIVHLHWVCDGFLDFTRFFSKVSKKVVWTLHDMNPFTGGCHHADDCLGYLADCKECPQLRGTVDSSLAGKMLARKNEALEARDEEMVIVTPSEWLLACSKGSRLFGKYNHYHICNAVQDEAFYVMSRASTREQLSLPEGKKIILCVAHNVDNPRKGYGLLLESLAHMQTQNVLLCTVGGIAKEWVNNPSIHQFGYIMEADKMRQLYNAADVFVLPSVAENFPNTIAESLLCGTPVAAFDVGGIPEQITEHNGVLVRQRTPESLAEELDQFFGKAEDYDRESISQAARNKYKSGGIVDQYKDVYTSMHYGDTPVARG